MKFRILSASLGLMGITACSGGEEATPETAWVGYSLQEEGKETQLIVSKAGDYDLNFLNEGESETQEGSLSPAEIESLDDLLSDNLFEVYRLDEPTNCEKNESNSIVVISRTDPDSSQRVCLDTAQLDHPESQELVDEMENLTQELAK